MRRRRAFDERTAAAWLTNAGWLREVAGDADFEVAAKAVSEMSADPRRGLLLMGNVGVGKTLLAEKVFAGVATRKVRVNCSDNDAVDDLVPPCDAQANGGTFNSAWEDYLGATVFLDDLGTEAMRQVYGNVLDRVGNFVVKYHLRGRGRLLVTTNLTAEAIERRYTSRVLDRLLERCVVAKFSGRTKRKWNIIGGKAG